MRARLSVEPGMDGGWLRLWLAAAVVGCGCGWLRLWLAAAVSGRVVADGGSALVHIAPSAQLLQRALLRAGLCSSRPNNAHVWLQP
jgi:hypothetical protein